MARSVAEIENDINHLKPEEQVNLIRTLIENMDSNREENIEEIWLQEAHKRYDEIKSGKVKTIPADEVIRNARARLGQ